MRPSPSDELYAWLVYPNEMAAAYWKMVCLVVRHCVAEARLWFCHKRIQVHWWWHPDCKVRDLEYLHADADARGIPMEARIYDPTGEYASHIRTEIGF